MKKDNTRLTPLVFLVAGCAMVAGNASLAADDLEPFPGIGGQPSFSHSVHATRKQIDLNEPAPFNDTPHFGNIGGIKIAIPREYWASVMVCTDTNAQTWCKDDDPAAEKFERRIRGIGLDLRQSNYEPIYTVRDLMDWANYHLVPYDKVASAHRWIHIAFESDSFERVQGNLAQMYRDHIHTARQHFGEFMCDEKFGMEHCKTSKYDSVVQTVPNEFFFDRAHGNVLIECVRKPATKGLFGFYLCSQYYPVPEIKAFAEMVSVTDEENTQWESRLGQIKRIASLIIAK